MGKWVHKNNHIIAPTLRDRVAGLYAQDIALLGYDF